jgi:hypothetical protein
MRRGKLIGAVIGFLAGLFLQSRATLTGMATGSISSDSLHTLGLGITLTLFIAALFGIIGAFVGAFMEEVFRPRR